MRHAPVLLAVALGWACTGDSATSKPLLEDGGKISSCPGGCPSGQRCLVSTGQCVTAGLVTCSPPCGSAMQCSALFPSPTCVFGRCGRPAFPGPGFPGGVSKVIALSVLDDASGCDLNGDGRPDNRLSQLQSFIDVNARLRSQIAADKITILLQPSSGGSLATPGTGLSLLFGTLAPASAHCPPDSPDAVCLYNISTLSFDPVTDADTCAAFVTFAESDVTARDLHVEVGPRSVAVALPIDASSWLIQLIGARLSLDVAPGDPVGPGLGLAMKGKLCGAVPQADLLAAIDTMPADLIAGVGGADNARRLIKLLLPPDLDGDGDGVSESVSGALGLVAAPARIAGYSP